MYQENNIDQSLWFKECYPEVIYIIDQRFLPFELVIEELKTAEDALVAITDMKVRGAPLIGVTAAFGMYLACIEKAGSEAFIKACYNKLKASRPTAVNLIYALDLQMDHLLKVKDPKERTRNAFNAARVIYEEEIAACWRIGEFGFAIIEDLAKEKAGLPVNVLTHCNAGWLATVKFGTALAPIYLAHEHGLPVHVWVDETRPRNQGSKLTAWELEQAGIPYTIITDNAGGHIMQEGNVDLVLTGSDRTARNGDSANKIGTYLKALAAFDNHIPFYIVVPSSSIDWDLEIGVGQIPVEERSPDEVRFMDGLNKKGEYDSLQLIPDINPVANFGFDVTPARLITGLITEAGVCQANEISLKKLFPKKFKA